jgi:MarR family transcriptional regulator, organic hydroperoxide resistance regulator
MTKAPPGGGPWPLLVKLFLAQRASLPPVAVELRLSLAQCQVLRLIEPDRPLPMGQLAETLSCHASNITGLVDRLESRGLVSRRPSDGDRRVKVLVLTAAGVQLRSVLAERLLAPPPALQRLSAGEQQALMSILERLLEEE